MIEGLVGLIEAFITAISALISAILHLIAALLESLGFPATKLATTPKVGERRFSAKRVAIAFAPLAVLLVTLPAMFWFISWRADVNKSNRKKTEAVVTSVANSLANSIAENGKFKRQGEFNEIDAWGRNLILDYSESDLTETLMVRSPGIDGKLHTLDDVVESRRNVLPIKDVAGAFARRIKDGIGKPISDQ